MTNPGTRIVTQPSTGGPSSSIGGSVPLGGIPMNPGPSSLGGGPVTQTEAERLAALSPAERAAEFAAKPVVPTKADAARSPALAKAKALEAAAVSKNAARKAAGQKRR